METAPLKKATYYIDDMINHYKKVISGCRDTIMIAEARREGAVECRDRFEQLKEMFNNENQS